MRVKMVAAGIASVIALIFVASMWNGLVGHNNTQNYQIYQSPFGSVSIIDTAGFYYKGFGTVWTYPCTMEAEYTAAATSLSPGDDSIKATFNDGGTAKISTYVGIQLPTANDKRLMLHQRFNANLKSIADSVKAHLANCIKAAGPVMSASENQASRKAEFNQIIEEQLSRGLFKMRRTEVELSEMSTIEDAGTDAAGAKITREKKARVQATEIVNGPDGKPVVIQPSPLNHYDLMILQFSITDIDYDEMTLTQFAAKKKSYLAAEQAKAERQQEVQQRLMVEEKGRRQVADVQAEENQGKERALIQAAKAAEVAVTNKAQAVTAAEQKTEVAIQIRKETEQLKEIARIKAETAELDKKATISRAEAQQKSIELGGGITEKEKVLAEIAAERDAKVAAALSNIRVPEVVFGGSGGQGGSATGDLMNMVLLRSLGILKDTPVKK